MKDQPPKQIQQSIHLSNDNNVNDIKEVSDSDSDNERDEKTLSYYDSEEELFGGPPSPLHTQDLIDWPVEQEQGEGVQAEKEEQPMEEQAIKQEQNVEEQEEEQTSKPHGRRSFTNEESTSLIRLCGEVLKSVQVDKSSTQQALLSSEEGRHLARTFENKFEGTDSWKTYNRQRSRSKKE